MRKILPLIFCCFLLPVFGEVPWERPARRLLVSPSSATVAGASDLEIVVFPDAVPAVRFAGRELQYFLEQSLGQSVPVVPSVSEEKFSLVLGWNSLCEKAGLNFSDLVRDGYFIKTCGRKVLIAGRDDKKASPEKEIQRGGVWSQLFERGTLFGVYDFAERVIGVRMYFPGELGTVIPKKARLTIPGLDIFDRPDFTQRSVSTFWDGTYFEGPIPDATINPPKTLNSYRLRLQTDRIPCCHGTNDFQYIKRFRKSHPEYFALLASGKRSNEPGVNFAGQLCWTSGIVEELYQDTRSYLKGEKPDVRKIPARRGTRYAWGVNCWKGQYVDIMPQDGFQPCQCPRCKAAYTSVDRYYATELIWGNVVKIADRLKQEKIPGYITQMAYFPYRRVPELAIPDNVLVMVAETGPWGEGNPVKQKFDNDEIKAWCRKLNHKVWLWNYVNKGSSLSMPGIPQMSPHAYGAYYQGLSPWIFGAFAESESDRFFYNYLNYYVFAKVAWDNTVDYKSLIEEHFQMMFGRAAAPMKAYYGQLEKIWVEQIAGNIVDTALGPVGAPPSDYKIWHDIYNKEKLQAMEKLLADAKKLVPGGSLEARRIDLARREFQGPLLKARENYMKQNQAARGMVLHISDKPGKAISLIPFRPKKKLESVSCEVQVWRTASHLGIRFNNKEPQMNMISALSRKKDDANMWKDNSVEIFLNPSGDRKNYYQLIVNSKGCFLDQKLARYGKTSADADVSWDSHAEISIENKADAWMMQALIPLKSLPGIQEEFPVNFARNRILLKGNLHHVLYAWGPFVNGFHDLEYYGTVTTRPDRNMLVNGDFSIPATRSKRHFGIWKGSAWAGGWIGQDNVSQKIDREFFVSHPASMRMDCDGSQAKTITAFHLPMKPNTRYRLSFYTKLKDVRPSGKGKAGSCGVYSNIWDDHNRWFPSHNLWLGTSDWNYHQFEFVSGPQTNVKVRSYLRLGWRNALGTVWFDDVRLEEIE